MDRVIETNWGASSTEVDSYKDSLFIELSHTYYVQKVAAFLDTNMSGTAVDLGCGTGTLTDKLAETLPNLSFLGIDRSTVMQTYSNNIKASSTRASRLSFSTEDILTKTFDQTYDFVFSANLLHHIPDPDEFWSVVNDVSATGSKIFIVEFGRPSSIEELNSIKEKLDDYEDVTQFWNDAINAMKSCFTVSELTNQLTTANLSQLNIEVTVSPEGFQNIFIHGEK